MTPHKQRFLHDPENGTFGDCDRTCMACLLDLNPDDVPHWGVHYDDTETFIEKKRVWLESQGYAEVTSAWDCSFEQMQQNLRLLFRDVYVLLTGTSRSGCHHVVITLNGEIVHDTSLTDAGIVGPCDGGFWFVSILVPLTLMLKRNVSDGR